MTIAVYKSRAKRRGLRKMTDFDVMVWSGILQINAAVGSYPRAARAVFDELPNC